MIKQTMTLREIAPFVRFAADVYIPVTGKYPTVTAYDHRLFYVVSGHAAVEINGTTHALTPGAVLYWMSGNAYTLYPTADATLHVIAVNFDFTQQNLDAVQYLPMVHPLHYDANKRLEEITFLDAPALNAPVFLQEVPLLLPYLRAMLTETSAPKSHGDFQLCSLMRIVLTHLCRAASQRQQTGAATHASSAAILDYVHAHYAEDLDNKRLAGQFHYHPNYLSRLIAEQTGTSLHQYLIKLRIRQALYLLQSTELPVNEIAHRVGFKSPAYFSHYFKQCTGHSPCKFRVGLS